jgi:hypothetical protein
VLLGGSILGLIAWFNESFIRQQLNRVFNEGPYQAANFKDFVLKPEEERALTRLASFHECRKDCPEMIAVPAGDFMMGSPDNEKGREPNEGPQHKVTITRRFAVSKFLVTFADWDACALVGGCPREGGVNDHGWGRVNQPVINVNWDDAQAYVAWLRRMTGKEYRLLSEAEWEYAARAGTMTAFYWGDELDKETPTAIAAKTHGANCKPPRSDRLSPIGSASPTWPAMCGNGCRIATMRTTTGRPPMAFRGRQAIARNASSAALHGTTIRRTRVRRTATGTKKTTGTTTPAFGSDGRLHLEPQRSTPRGAVGRSAPWVPLLAHPVNSR